MNRRTLRNLRGRCDWTQEKAGRKISLSQRGYQDKEAGRRKITRQEARLIACFRLIERLKAKIKAKH
jgi:DNA-binding XRE family transcriptional regulator